jgi:hypothetical protein
MIYLILLIYLIALSAKFDFNRSAQFNRASPAANGLYNFTLIIMITFAGLRYKVGGDSISYFYLFNDVPYLWELGKFSFAKAQFDPLWILLSSLSKSIYNDFTFFQIVQAIIVNTIVFRFFSRTTPNRFTCILIYFLIFYVYFNMEVMRESLAICCFLLGYKYFKEGKWLKFYPFAIVAFLFHSSAMILFILPLVRNIKIKPYTVIIWVALFVVAVVLPDTFKLFLKFFVFNERISARFNAYSDIRSNSNGMMFLFAIYFLFPAGLAILNEKRLDKNPRFRELYFAYFLIATLTIGFSGFNRFINYMTPFMTIYFADLLNKIYRNSYFFNTRKLLITFVIALAFVPKLLYYFSDTSSIVQGTYRYDIWYPYHTVLDKEENYKREALYEGLFSGSD